MAKKLISRVLAFFTLLMAPLLLTAPATASPVPELDDQAYDRMIAIANVISSKGYSDAAVAGILGNLYGESGFAAYAMSQDGHGSWGIAQFTGGRRTAAENFVRAGGGMVVDTGKPEDAIKSVTLQAEYMIANEAEGTHASWWSAGNISNYSYLSSYAPFTSAEEAKTASEPSRVAALWMANLEVPAWSGPYASHVRDSWTNKRSALAESVFELMQSNSLPGYKGSGVTSTNNNSEAMGVKGSEGATNDRELIGMPASWQAENGQGITLPDASGLTRAEQTNLKGWAESNELQSQFNTGHLVRSGVMFVGLLLMLFAVVVMFAVGLDITVPALDGKATKVATFGHYQYTADIEAYRASAKGKKPHMVGIQGSVGLVVSLIVLASIVISGSLSTWLSNLLYQFL